MEDEETKAAETEYETELTFHGGFFSINGGWLWLMTKSTITGEDLMFRNLITVWRRFEFLDLQEVGREIKLEFVSWNLQNKKEKRDRLFQHSSKKYLKIYYLFYCY